MERNYAAFISYRHAPWDSAVAKAVHSLIEQYHIPKAVRPAGKKKLGLVFRDQEELSASHSLSEEIRHALDHAEHLIVICSPDTAASTWVPQEIEYFLSNHSREKVFLVLAGGEPKDVFPKALTELRNEDGTVTRVEPLAADARAKNVGGMRRKLRGEILRLLAPMIGCPYDALVLREQKRRRRKSAAVIAAVLAAAVGIGAALTVIDRKNQELARQQEARQQEARQQEALRLASDAEAALAAGDYLAALRSAVDSLENGAAGGTTAERVLMDALNTFGSEQAQHYMLSSTVMEQSTPVAGFSISDDGSLLVTTDDYGTLNAYDTATGRNIWTANADTNTGSTEKPGVSCLGGMIISQHSGRLSAFDPETGEKLWACEASGLEDGYTKISPDQTKFVSLCSALADGACLYDLLVISAEDGSIQRTIPLQTDDPLRGISFSDTTDNGGFSDDGTLFAGTYFSEDQAGNCVLHYYLADLTSGEVRILRTAAQEGYYFEYPVFDVAFLDEGAALLIVRGAGDDSVGIVLEKIDVQTGALLWQAASPAEDSAYYFDRDDPISSIGSNNRYYIARKDRLYGFDLENGTYLCGEELDADIVSIDPVGGNFFGYVLKDGTYRLAWRNSFGFQNSAYRGAVFDVGIADRAALWNGGFLRAQVTDGSISDMLLGDAADGFGYLALVPDENKCSMVIKRILVYDTGTAPEYVDMRDAMDVSYYPDDATGICLADTVVIGPFSMDRGDGYQDYYAVLDAETRAVLRTFQLPAYSRSAAWFLPDGTGCMLSDEAGNIYRYDAITNTTATLSQSVALDGHTGCKAASDSARQTIDGSILTACCDGETLQLWRDGRTLDTVRIPEDICWQYDTGESFRRRLKVGKNGYVLLTDYPEDSAAGNFVVYDTASGSWYHLPETVNTESCISCYPSAANTWVGAYDNEGNYDVYDVPTGACVSEFSLQLPSNSLLSLVFARNDSLLLVKTRDCQLLIFDVLSGEVLFKDQLGDTDYNTRISVSIDEENGRLYVTDCYLSDNCPNGICIDMTSWEKLGEIENMLCFDAARGKLYRTDYLEALDDFGLVLTDIPAAAELIELAKAALGE